MKIFNMSIRNINSFVNLSEILKRIKEVKGFSKDKEVAELFSLSPQDFSNRKKSGTLLPFILDWALEEDVNLNWIFKGKDGPTQGVSLDRLPHPYCTFVKNLAEVPKGLKTEKYVMIPLVSAATAADPIISEDKIEGWAVIHASEVGRRTDLVATRVDKRIGRSMEPLIRTGSMIAIDRGDRRIVRGKPFAVKSDFGCTIKFIKRIGDGLILFPSNAKDYEPEVLDLRRLNYDPIVGRVIWNWQTL